MLSYTELMETCKSDSQMTKRNRTSSQLLLPTVMAALDEYMKHKLLSQSSLGDITEYSGSSAIYSTCSGCASLLRSREGLLHCKSTIKAPNTIRRVSNIQFRNVFRTVFLAQACTSHHINGTVAKMKLLSSAWLSLWDFQRGRIRRRTTVRTPGFDVKVSIILSRPNEVCVRRNQL